jgi:hypothetical protein
MNHQYRTNLDPMPRKGLNQSRQYPIGFSHIRQPYVATTVQSDLGGVDLADSKPGSAASRNDTESRFIGIALNRQPKF